MLMLLMTAGAARLTLNLPAVHALGTPEAVRLSVADGHATVRAAPRGEDGSLDLFARDRGGRGCVVPLDVVQRLAAALGLSPSRPYCLVRPAEPSGNFALLHHDRDGVPARHLAAARLWFPSPPPEQVDKVRDEDFADVDRDDADLPFGSLVRRANAMVRRGANQLGRPSTELVEARRVMAAFDRLVRDVRPELLADRAALQDDLRAAAEALNRSMARLRADA